MLNINSTVTSHAPKEGETQMNRSRFKKAAAALSVVAMATLAACSSGPAPVDSAKYGPVPDGEKVELKVWFGREDFMADDKFKSFMAEYPHITVKTDVVPVEQIATNFIRQAQAGDAPDVIQPEAGATAALGERGLLYDMTPIIEDWKSDDPGLYEALAASSWVQASHKDVIHGVTLFQDSDWNIYRADVLEELGLPVPTTWDDVLDTAEAITKAKPGMYGYGLDGARDRAPERDKNIFAQMGGQWVDGVMQIDSDAGRYWLNFYQQLVSRGAIDPATIALTWSDYVANFAEGQVGMGVMSRNVWLENLAPRLEYGTQWKIKTEPYVRPGGEADARMLARGWPFLVSATTKHPYEVGLLLRYLADDKQALSVAVRYQPTTNARAMEDPAYLTDNPWGAVLAEPTTMVKARPKHVHQAALDEVIRDAIQEALSNPTADVNEMATRYQTKLNEVAAEVE